MRKIEYDGWTLEIKTPTTIVITKLGESREYNVATIVEVNNDEDMEEYVYLTHGDNAFTQVKFEVDNFLVIDLFDKNGNLLKEIGSHVFGEELELDEESNCIYCGQKCYDGDMCDEQQAGGFNE